MKSAFRKSFTRDLKRIKDREVLAAEGDTVEFVRCLPRRDLYRFFP
jgi:hypothetical protein